MLESVHGSKRSNSSYHHTVVRELLLVREAELAI